MFLARVRDREGGRGVGGARRREEGEVGRLCVYVAFTKYCVRTYDVYIDMYMMIIINHPVRLFFFFFFFSRSCSFRTAERKGLNLLPASKVYRTCRV